MWAAGVGGLLLLCATAAPAAAAAAVTAANVSRQLPLSLRRLLRPPCLCHHHTALAPPARAVQAIQRRQHPNAMHPSQGRPLLPQPCAHPCAADGAVRVFDLCSAACTQILRLHSQGVTAVQAVQTPAGDLLVRWVLQRGPGWWGCGACAAGRAGKAGPSWGNGGHHTAEHWPHRTEVSTQQSLARSPGPPLPTPPGMPARLQPTHAPPCLQRRRRHPHPHHRPRQHADPRGGGAAARRGGLPAAGASLRPAAGRQQRGGAHPPPVERRPPPQRAADAGAARGHGALRALRQHAADLQPVCVCVFNAALSNPAA